MKGEEGRASPAKANRLRQALDQRPRKRPSGRATVGLTDAPKARGGSIDEKKIMQLLEELFRRQQELSELIREAFGTIEYRFQTIAHQMGWDEAETVH